MNEEHKKKQKWLMYILAGTVLVITIFIAFYTFDDKKTSQRTFSTTADLPFDKIDPKEIWIDQLKSENEVVQGKVDYIQDMLVERLKNEEKHENVTQNEISSLRNEIEILRSELKKNQSHSPTIENLRSEIKNATQNQQSQTEGWDPFVTQAQAAPPRHEIFVPLTCATCHETTNLKHVDRSIPTGTTVKAILLSSVDMPCGVKGGTDPLPVKLRIIADGRLPHAVRARLKGGIVTASVYGDLSSERVYMRLEKLTQVRGDGHFIETEIAGYVSGEDGKYGVRGTVVDKSCQLIENALISGFFSGASNFFESVALARLNPCSQFGACAPGISNVPNLSWQQTAGQMGIAGGSQGVTNAMDALTDYFIQRAEQLRPVIQITSGRTVDITFSDNADLGDLHTHARVRQSGREEICAY